MSSNDSTTRQGAVGGIVFAILTIVGFAIVIPKPPALDSSAAVIAAYYADHQDALRVGLTIAAIAIFFFIWFLGSLRGVLAAAEGGNGRLASIAYGGGLVAAAVLMLGIASAETAAFRPDDVDPGVTRAFSDFFAISAAPATSALVAFFAATAIAGFRHRALPEWAAWISAIAAVCQLPAIGAGVTTSGAFAGDGVLGLLVPVFGIVGGVISISVAMLRNPAPAAASTKSLR
jgi:hypothetical protein